MAHPNPIRRLLDAGLQVTELTQANAERVVHELVRTGEVRRKDTEKVVREMLEHSREASERVRVTVRDEVGKQFGAMAGRLDQVESLIEQLVAKLTPGSPSSGGEPATPPASAPKQAAAKHAAPTKAAPKKSAPKKAAGKKSTAKKATVKKAPAKRGAASTSDAPPVGAAAPASSAATTSAAEPAGSAD